MCSYFYTYDGKEISASTVDELKQKLFTQFGLNGFRSTFVDGTLIFYNATDADKVRSVLEYYKHNTLLQSHSSVTELSKKFYTGEKTEKSEAEQKVLLFRQTFGEKLHKCIEANTKSINDYNEAIDDLINYCKIGRRELYEFELEGGHNILGNELLVKNQSILQLAAFFSSFNEVPFRDQIIDVTSNIKKLLQDLFGGTNWTLEPEFKLWAETALDNVSGRADLIAYNEEGKVIILDFKTSSKSWMDTGTLKEHYHQLEMYKQMLVKAGIPEGNIKTANLLLVYNNKGLSVNKLEDPVEVLGIDAGDVISNIRQYFPLEGIKLSESEHLERLKKVTEMSSTITHQLMTKSYELDSLKSAIENSIKNETARYMELAEKQVVKWEKKDDIIIGRDNSNNVIVKGTLDEIALKEKTAEEKEGRNNTRILAEVLMSKDINRLKNFLKTKDTLKQRLLYHALYPFLSNQWEYVHYPDLEEQNIIVLKNLQGLYLFISTISNAGELRYSADPRKNMLSSVLKDQTLIDDIKEFKELPLNQLGNMYKIKTFITLSQYQDLFEEGAVIKGVMCVSLVSGLHDLGLDADKFIRSLLLLEYIATNDPDKLENAELYQDCYSNITKLNWIELGDKDTKLNAIKDKVLDALRVVSINHNDTFGITLDDLKERQISIDEILKYLKTNYPSEVKDADNDIGILYGDLAQCSLYLLGLTPEDIFKMHQRSLTFQESILAGIDLVRYGEVKKFTNMGLMLTGLAQGLETSISYASPDATVRLASALFSAYSALIVDQLIKDTEELRETTKKFIESQYRFKLIDRISGDHDSEYLKLLLKDSKGDISRLMLFVNPYDNKELTKELAEYLEVILWTINRHRMSKHNRLSDAAFNLSYKELRESHFFNEYKNLLSLNQEYLEVPLKRKEGIAGWKNNISNLITGKKSISQWAKDETDRWRQFVDPAILNEELASQREQLFDKLEYTNYYDDRSNRISITEKTLPNEWDLNLDRLTVDYVASCYKEVYFTKLLPIIDKLIASIRIMELVTGLDLSNLVEAIKNRIKISVYNGALVSDEDSDMIKVMGLLKTGVSLAKIAVRPALYMKEMLLGRIRNTSAILTHQIHNDNNITMKNLMRAAQYVFGGDMFRPENTKLLNGKSAGDFNFVDLLNNVYTINDRDLNNIADNLSYDRYGYHNFGMRMLFLNTISPDWFNRMIIFIAKMDADGTLEAHSINEKGQLIYDPSKDARISVFWNNRPKRKGDAELNTPEYVKLKAYYINRMLLFATEGWKNPEGNALSWGQLEDTEGNPIYDVFPRAYTVLEQDSIKEQIGLIYGYYGHEEKANMQKGWWWTMHTQFLTFLPSEIRRYFATGTINSSVGAVVHKLDPIENKKLYWKKDGYVTKAVKAGENGISEDGVDTNTGETLEPVLEWANNSIEGLATSAAKTIGLVCRGDWEALRKNKQQIDNTKLFFFNLLFGLIVGWIVASLTAAGLAKDNPVAGVSFDLLSRSARELNFALNISQAVGGFGLVGVDALNDLIKDTSSSITVNGLSLAKFSNKVFPIVKDTHLIS